MHYYSIQYITTVEIGFFCPTKCTGKEEKKTRYAKKPVFDNKLHNEVATYSKSAVLNLFGTISHFGRHSRSIPHHHQFYIKHSIAHGHVMPFVLDFRSFVTLYIRFKI